MYWIYALGLTCHCILSLWHCYWCYMVIQLGKYIMLCVVWCWWYRLSCGRLHMGVSRSASDNGGGHVRDVKVSAYFTCILTYLLCCFLRSNSLLLCIIPIGHLSLPHILKYIKTGNITHLLTYKWIIWVLIGVIFTIPFIMVASGWMYTGVVANTNLYGYVQKEYWSSGFLRQVNYHVYNMCMGIGA